MNGYTRVASWIDRFVSRLMRYDVSRKEAVESAFSVWNEQGIAANPERAADALYAAQERGDLTDASANVVDTTRSG